MATAAAMPLELTDDAIARRAYEISESDECGTDDENWFRAEQELRASAPAPKRRRLTAVKTAASDKPSRIRKPKTAEEKGDKPGK